MLVLLVHVLRLDLYFTGTQQFAESSPEAGVAEGIEHGIDGRVNPQKPEGDLVQVVLNALTMTGGSDDHQECVRSPAQAKHAHDHGQRLGHLFVPGEPKAAGQTRRDFRSVPVGSVRMSGAVKPRLVDHIPDLQRRKIRNGAHSPLCCPSGIFRIGSRHRSAGQATTPRPGRVLHHAAVFGRPDKKHALDVTGAEWLGFSGSPVPEGRAGGAFLSEHTAVPDVDVDAEVEVCDTYERREELNSGGGHQEVPVEVELGVALAVRNHAVPGDVFPADDGRAVEQERGQPDTQHLQHRLAGHALLAAVTHLEQRTWLIKPSPPGII